jgi:hypothetical protein
LDLMCALENGTEYARNAGTLNLRNFSVKKYFTESLIFGVSSIY